MASKKKLRAVIERLEDRNAVEWWAGFEWCDSGALDKRPWAAHLARVTDAAREQGRREGWAQAWAAGARADEDAYRRGWEDAVADATLAAGAALLRDMDHQPQPETTPEHANACGCDCACASIPKPWREGPK